MLDWFASKLGMMIFVVVVGMLILSFFIVQSNVFDKEIDIRHAQNIARLIDAVSTMSGKGASYTIDRDYTIEIDLNDGFIVFNGVKRYFIGRFSGANGFPKSGKAGNILIRNDGGELVIS